MSSVTGGVYSYTWMVRKIRTNLIYYLIGEFLFDG